MNLRDYEWFNNPRGLRNKGPYAPFETRRYLRPRMGWARLEVGGDEYVDAASALVEEGCMPIVRIYRSHMGAMPAPEDWYDIYAAYVDAGCRWFELYDAPNLSDAWPLDQEGEPRVDVTWENVDGCITPLAESWIDWAERIVDLGGYPAFPAFAPRGDMAAAAVYWMDALLHELVDRYPNRFTGIIGNGLWCAARPAASNLFYQEPPAGPKHVARPYYQQIAREPGWHFEHPYDPILQRHDPGRTVFGGTEQAPYGDTSGLVAGGEAFYHLLRLHAGAGPVPVVATAGGIAPIPRPGAAPFQPDDLYPPYDRDSHAEATLALFEWIARQGPSWFFGITLSDETVYYDGPDGVVPAIDLLAEVPPLGKAVPSIEVGSVPARARAEAVEAIPADLPAEEWIDAVDLDAPDPEAASAGVLDWADDAGDDLWARFVKEYELSMEEPEGDVMEDDRQQDFGDSEEEMGEPGISDEDIAEDERERGAITEEDLRRYATEGEIDPADLPPGLDLDDVDLMDMVEDTEEEDEVAEQVEEDLGGAGVEVIDPADEIEGMSDYEEEITEEEGLPAVETDADYVDMSGQMVDAYEDDEAIPPLRLDDLPPDMKEELAAITGAEEPEELAEDVELPIEEETTPGPPADEMPRTEVETQETLLQSMEEPGPVDVEVLEPEPPGGTYHWVIIAGGIDPDWFFEAGDRYWGRFRPTVTTGWDALAHFPRDRQVAVTLIAPAEKLDEIEAQIRATHAGVEIDPIVCESEEDLRTELNWRVETGKRLG
jgi:hypothetical protein